MKFMIIEILFDIDYIYRYDFESFFYVLIWFCARREWNFCKNSNDRFIINKISRWYIDNFENITQNKLANIIKVKNKKFDKILKKFSWAFDYVKFLCESLRDILFSYEKKNELDIEIKKNIRKFI